MLIAAHQKPPSQSQKPGRICNQMANRRQSNGHSILVYSHWNMADSDYRIDFLLQPKNGNNP